MLIGKNIYEPEMFRSAVRGLFYNLWDTQPLGMYPIITTETQSDGEDEVYLGFDNSTPILRKWQDERQVTGLNPMFRYSIKNEKYEVTVGIERDHLEDAKLNYFKQQIAGLPKAVMYAYDQMVFDKFRNGHLTTYNGESNLCHDQKAYFAADHDNGSGNQSNVGAVAFSKTALQDAIEAMNAFKDPKGKLFAVNPDTLLCGPHLWWKVIEELNATSYVATALQQPASGAQSAALAPQFNSINLLGLNVVKVPFLTSQTEWYLMDSKQLAKPIILQHRTGVEFDSITNPSSSESVFMQDDYLFGIRVRFGLGFGPWYACYRGNA
jgi:phage major head subunit gpT-like protein